MPEKVVSKQTAVFKLWQDKQLSPDFVPEDWKCIFQFEHGHDLSVIPKHPIGQLGSIFDIEDNSVPIHKRVVRARQLLQVVEKFQFIMQKNNLSAHQIDDNFVIFFNACETGIVIIRLFV